MKIRKNFLWTDRQTDVWTDDTIPALLGRLGGVDLKIKGYDCINNKV